MNTALPQNHDEFAVSSTAWDITWVVFVESKVHLRLPSIPSQDS